MGAHKINYAVATGTISAVPGNLYSVSLSGTAAGTVLVQSGGTTGGTLVKMTCGANGYEERRFGVEGVSYAAPLVATFNGVGANAGFEVDL